MKNYIGLRWRDLKKDEKDFFLKTATAIDGIMGIEMKKDGDCIIDLAENMSINGRVKDGEIFISASAVIYNPAEGLTGAKARYDKNNTTVKTLKLNKKTDADILERLEKEDNFQGYIKQLIRKDMSE